MAEQYSPGAEEANAGLTLPQVDDAQLAHMQEITALQEGLVLPEPRVAEHDSEAPIMMTMERALAGHEPLPVLTDESIANFPALVEFLEGENALGPGTVLVLDFDGTTVKMQKELLSAMALKPNEIHSDSMAAIQKAMDAGCKISIASNQPEALHKLVSKFATYRNGYTYFPRGATERGVEVFIGKKGGELAVGHGEKYKSTEQAVTDVSDWIMRSEEEGGAGFDAQHGVVVMVGDRVDTDFDYFARLNDELIRKIPDANTLAVKMPDLGVIRAAKQYTGLGRRLLQRLVSKLP